MSHSSPLLQRRLYQSDRFIPARSAMDFDACHHSMTRRHLDARKPAFEPSRSYQDLLDTNYCHRSSGSQPRPLLAIRTPSTRNHLACTNQPYAYVAPLSRQMGSACHRSLSPSCILDAPDLRNDFYLNVMDWGTNGLLAIALHQRVHLYSSATGEIQTLDTCVTPRDYVTSVKWAHATRGNEKTYLLAVGTSFSELQLWDVETLTKLRSLHSHCKQIGSLSWNGPNLLASGSRDATIQLHDLRCAHSVVQKLSRHKGEVCGLSWSPDGTTLASGSSHHQLCLWDHAMVRPSGGNELAGPRSVTMEHQAPVRALAWSPYDRHTLASGGGTADSTIKLWRTSSGQLVHSVPTGAQVCALVWSTTTRQLVSAHGYGSNKNELTIWSDATLARAHTLAGHTARVLNAAISPSGTTVVSSGADETLRFWNIFPEHAPCRQWTAELSCSATNVIR